MNQPSSFKTIHGIGVALAAAMVAVFLWSTLGAAAFNGPTQNPSGGNGSIYSDSSNNVYIGGNLNVTGTITGSGLGGSTINAANVSAGDFGSNTGGGQYNFRGFLSIGSSSPGGDYDAGLFIQDTGNSSGGGLLAIERNNDFEYNDNTGDFLILGNGSNDIQIGASPNQVPDLTVASSGYVGIGTTGPLGLLEVASGTDPNFIVTGGSDIDGTGAYSGFVGINTASPDADLTIADPTSGATLNLYSFDAPGVDYGGIQVSHTGLANSTNESLMLQPHGGPVGIGDYSGSNEPLSALGVAGGAVIGTDYETATAATNGLTVEGNVAIGTSVSSTYPLYVNGSTTASAYCIGGANCITAWPGGSSGANPTASIGTTAVNGSASTFMRSDAAPTINTAATFSFSALGNTTSTGNISAASMKIGGVAVSTSTGANPTGQIGTSAVNGSATTFMRSDAAPAINTAATFSFSALGNTTSTANIGAKTFTATGVSSTIKLGTSINASHGCIELYDAVNSSTIDYIYASSTALVITSSKPTFCL